MQSAFKIEKNVPLPRRLGPGGHNQKYPLDRLAVGESFFVPVGPEGKEKFRHRIKAAVRNYGKRHGLTFTRKWQEDPAGFRVWRVS